MTVSPFSGRRRHPHNQWLLLIAMYKLLHAAVFIAIGVGALRLLHKDVADMLSQLADHWGFDPEERIVRFLLEKAELVNDPLLKKIGAAAFCYAALGLLESVGLYLEKAWGEILTLIVTASFLPWELFEIIRRLTWFRLGLFAINIFVFLYLLKLVANQRRRKRPRRA